MAEDAFGGANSPASMALISAKFEFGLDIFTPLRSAKRSNSLVGINGDVASGSTSFAVPEIAYCKA